MPAPLQRKRKYRTTEIRCDARAAVNEWIFLITHSQHLNVACRIVEDPCRNINFWLRYVFHISYAIRNYVINYFIAATRPVMLRMVFYDLSILVGVLLKIS